AGAATPRAPPSPSSRRQVISNGPTALARAGRPLGVAGHPALRLLQLGAREHTCLARDHPSEELRRPCHPVDVGDDGRANPRVMVPDAQVEPELGIGPEGARLDLIQVIYDVQRPQAVARL